MFWPYLLGQARAAGEEALGRSFLPDLQNLFIAPCFRADPADRMYSPIVGGPKALADATVQSCLITSINHYGKLLMGVAVLVCFVYIVRAGYIMFTAFGDEAKYAQGKKTLLYAVIGLAIAIAAGFIIRFFVDALGYSGPDVFKIP